MVRLTEQYSRQHRYETPWWSLFCLLTPQEILEIQDVLCMSTAISGLLGVAPLQLPDLIGAVT